MLKGVLDRDQFMQLRFLFGNHFCVSCSSNLRGAVNALEKGLESSHEEMVINKSYTPSVTVKAVMDRVFNERVVKETFPELYELLEQVSVAPREPEALQRLQEKMEDLMFKANFRNALNVERLYNLANKDVKSLFNELQDNFVKWLESVAATPSGSDFLRPLCALFEVEHLMVILVETLIASLRPYKETVNVLQ